MYVRVKGFQIFTDRHGKARCYHRTTRTPIDLEKYPIGSAGFLAECQRIAALMGQAEAPKPGTLGLLIERYRGHAEFQDLAPRTQADYQRIFDYLHPIADTELVRFTPPLVVRIRDKAAETKGRRFGTYVKTVLSLLFSWGVERGFLDTNPAFKVKGVKRPRGAPQANRPWTDAEREAVLAELPPRLKGPIAFMMFTGLDPGDTLKLPRSAIRDGAVCTRRAKTGVAVDIRIIHQLAEILDAQPSHDATTLFVSGRGRPWTKAGFDTEWRKVRLRLETEGKIGKGLTPKGLRHTVATILAEAGFDERSIADMLGQKTTEMARHYSRRADKHRKLTAVVADFEAEVNRRRTKIVKPPG